MKVCGKCKQLKEEIEFHHNPSKKDGLATMCKSCRKIYHREHYLKNKNDYIERANKQKEVLKEWYIEKKKNLKCKKCGDDRWYVLHFHHKEKGKKEFSISRMIHDGFSKDKIVEEISKCEMLCANCHLELHYLENAKLA